MQLLTTKALLGRDQRLLTVTNATSAAPSRASFLAGSILADDPTLWPEPVRALIVHSAEWTAAMRAHFRGAPMRAQKRAPFRSYGMGVPDVQRATRSARDALMLIAEDIIHPFDGNGHAREMHLQALPWPADELAGLGDVEVRLRITLSYFIEPNAAGRGWVRRYSYASHGLRFAVRQPTETTDDFRKRINKQARAEDERAPGIDSDANDVMTQTGLKESLGRLGLPGQAQSRFRAPSELPPPRAADTKGLRSHHRQASETAFG